MAITSGEGAARQPLARSWPLEFFEKRGYFERKAENQSYLEWLKDYLEDDEGGEEGDEGDEEYEGDEGSTDENKVPADDNIVDEQKETKSTVSLPGDDRQAISEEPTSVELGDEDGGDLSKEIETNSRADDYVEELCNGRSIARVFMKGMIGDEKVLPYRDQVDVVAGFAEQEVAVRDVERVVALIDDRDFAGNPLVRRRHARSPTRPDWGPLKAKELREELRVPRFKDDSKQNRHPKVIAKEDRDIVRRVVFLIDLRPPTLEAVLATAPRSHALALKNFFYEHIKGRASIGVTIPSQGFKVFTFSLQIPYYYLTEGEPLLSDLRKTFDGKDLRRSWHLSFLSPSKTTMETSFGHCLYESQMSVTVTGIDHLVWTAYGLFDNYHGCSDSMETYIQTKTPSGEPDPLTAGQLTAHNLISTPRHYFFKVFEIRIGQVRKEWRAILDTVEEEVEKSVHPLKIDHWNTIGVRKIGEWNEEMVKFLRRLSTKLGDTISAWDRFQRKDICYFLYDDELSTTDLLLKNSVNEVDNVFLDLRDILEKLRQLEEGLCRDSPQGLNAHISHGNHEAQLFQQKSARFIQVLTVITIAYLPLALAAAVFSTTAGVLPFTPNFRRFMLCLIVFGVLVVASIILVFKLHVITSLIPKCLCWWSREELWDPEQGIKEERRRRD